MEAAGERVEEQIGAMLSAALGVWQQHDALPALKPSVVYDIANNAVWLKAVARSQARHSSPGERIHELFQGMMRAVRAAASILDA